MATAVDGVAVRGGRDVLLLRRPPQQPKRPQAPMRPVSIVCRLRSNPTPPKMRTAASMSLKKRSRKNVRYTRARINSMA